MGAQLRFADEISQSGGTPQAARPMHQSSHRVTLRVAKVGRKQAEPVGETTLRLIGRMRQMLDAL